MTNVIKLNLINQSNDTNNSEYVIFQQNVAPNINEPAVAWLVVQNLSQGSVHPFTYSFQTEVAAEDSFGNFTPRLPSAPGDAFHMVKTASGDTLKANGQASSPKEIDISNDLAQGSINAMVYRDGNLVAQKTGVSPAEKAVFSFKPVFFIGVASQVQQGQVMSSAIVSTINTQISLLGVASADIVITGGGVGPNAKPFAFNLTNVTFAASARDDHQVHRDHRHE